ncbi:MAG TPA: VPLPA-CTERM sorting domain-containing protein, partial [Dissulfurispiraceae bacterium]|nr:VPLPA-CTERM sorting domain-containing protein [Dissulfurispiraceae bacterium]
KINVLLLIFLLSVALVSFAENAHASLGLDFSASAPYENGGPATFGANNGYTVVGWIFRPNVDLYLTRLGIFDGDVDRMHQELHQIGIWAANSPAAPLASVSISEYTNNPKQSPLGSMFHFADVGNILLHAGQTYYVGATLYSGPATGSNNTTDFDTFAAFDRSGRYSTTYNINSYIQYLGNAYGISTSSNQLVFPGLSTTLSDFTVGANIDVTPVPVPAAFYLFGSGFAALAGLRRKLDI